MTSDQQYLTNKIVELSESKNYFDAIDEWDLIYMNDLGVEIGHCTCGHLIRYEYHLKNKENGKNLIVGSTCINRFDEKNKQLNKKIKWVDDAIRMEKVNKFNTRIFHINIKGCIGKKFEEIMENERLSKWVVTRDISNWKELKKIKCFRDFSDFYYLKKEGKLTPKKEEPICLL